MTQDACVEAAAAAAPACRHPIGRRLPNWLLSLLLLLPVHVLAASPSGWLDSRGVPNASARDALQLLSNAPADGLIASDYQVGVLAQSAAALESAAGAAPAASQAAFEGAMNRALERYLHDLHFGRVDPRTVGFRLARPPDEAIDVAALLRAATAQDRLPALVAGLRPRLAQYDQLRQALAHYRSLDASHRSDPIRIPLPLRPGDAFDGAAELHRLLRAFGDLSADAKTAGDRYDDLLVEGVKRFQGRHGLSTDGLVGRATLAALNIPISQRIQQLELALERLRWLPRLDEGRFIGINIPMFRLWAWDTTRPTEASPISMGVVVGKALNTRTPVLFDEMRYLTFRPYWNVPRSILTNELLPALARDPGYLERNDLEIVQGGGDHARTVAAGDASTVLLRQGVLRIRQRPGSKNSLGLVKFFLANGDNVYLHGTPAMSLFSQPRRDLSHGCVRLEDPVGLAQWVLADQPSWTREHIQQAMAGPKPLRVNLTKPIPVVLFYVTAMVFPSDRMVHFATDIYGHDATLARALQVRREARRLPGP